MILAGIDEAGYGPLLGPLCVAMVVIRIEDAERPDGSGSGALPDLWERLAPAVVREPRLAGPTSIAVADSKRLKLSNALKSRHPLVHLERGVLSLAGPALGDVPDDLSLCVAAGASPPIGRSWWSGAEVPLPMSCSRESLDLVRSHVRGVSERARVRVLEARCLAMDAPEFNAALGVAGRAAPRAGGDGEMSKARVLFGQVGRLLRRVWLSREALLAGEDPSSEPPRIVVDRQGGRTDYAGVLREVLPDAELACLGMSAQASSYEAWSSAGERRRIRVLFRAEAESFALPVALASMLAKLIRELWMGRFNAHWCARMPELKPTAGYVADGRRWLLDAAPLLDDETRSLLCRAR